MSDAFEGLQTMGPAPEDLDQRLAAYRVVVAPMNVEQFLVSQADVNRDFDRIIGLLEEWAEKQAR